MKEKGIFYIGELSDLFNIGLHLEQIKEFVMNRTVQSTINLLEQEIITINEAILKLYEQKNSIQNRLGAVKDCLDINSFEKVHNKIFCGRVNVRISVFLRCAEYFCGK